MDPPPEIIHRWLHLSKNCTGFWQLEDRILADYGQTHAEAFRRYLERLTLEAPGKSLSWEEFRALAVASESSG